MGKGVDVAKIHLDRVLLNRLPSALSHRFEHLLLAFRDELKKGTKLCLVAKRFDTSERLVKIHRLSRLEKNYPSKIRLMEDYIRVENLPNKERPKALVKVVLTNLADESTWIRWNSLYEIKGLLENKIWAFTTGDLAYLEKIKKTIDKDTMKASYEEVIQLMTPHVKEGPALVEYREKQDTEKEKNSDQGNSLPK